MHPDDQPSPPGEGFCFSVFPQLQSVVCSTDPSKEKLVLDFRSGSAALTVTGK
jgi:hypothetical protein